MSAYAPVVSVEELVDFASGSSTLIERALDENAPERRLVERALAAAEGVGVRYLRWPADAPGLRVHARRDVLFSHGYGPDGALFYPAVRPAVQYGSTSGTIANGLLAVRSARPYADAVTTYYAGYRGEGETTADLRAMPGLDGLAEDAVVPPLPPALFEAVAESAVAIATRVDSGLIGKRESTFNVTTSVRTTVRLERDALAEIWDTYAQGFRVPVL